ncbi:AAA family ATPase (plasmid) [Mycobacterium sp. TJFP1]|uniref:nucleotide-binding protein n=1 Tax=Mycobacterium sp. MS1601 TaxID=1936029 RepID=UPI0009F8EC4E|nr:AAA family ATPase [Mycobacterium sp. MS1601]
MAEDVDTGNGRHWSEPETPAESTQSAPSESSGLAPESGAAPEDLPGPPPTMIAPAGAGDWSARPDTPPPAPPAQGRDRFGPDATATPPPPSRPQPSWGQPPAQNSARPNGAPAPAQSGPAQWGAQPAAPAQQWGQPTATPQAQRPGPAMAPRRPQQPQPPQGEQFRGSEEATNQHGHFRPSEMTAQIPVVPDQERGRQSVPDREQAVGRQAEPDQYRRANAPIQAASAGIRQELIVAANEERTPVANTGWRGATNKAGFKLKPSKKEQRRRDVYARIRAPKDTMYAIAVLTLKGGAGKTTVTATLGQTFAKYRSDGILAVDADPDAGDLPSRTAVHPNNLSMMEMLDTESNDLRQHDQVQRFLSTTDTDLNVLANGWRPDGERVLVPEDISDVYEIASHYYSMLLWDGDKALNSAVVREMLNRSNALVLLVEASRPGAEKAGYAIDWLRNHGYQGLLARTVAVINETTANTRLDVEKLTTVLARQQLKMHHIPFDPHLDEGLFVDLDKLKKKTRRKFEDLAAILADDFSVPQPPAPVAAAS